MFLIRTKNTFLGHEINNPCFFYYWHGLRVFDGEKFLNYFSTGNKKFVYFQTEKYAKEFLKICKENGCHFPDDAYVELSCYSF